MVDLLYKRSQLLTFDDGNVEYEKYWKFNIPWYLQYFIMHYINSMPSASENMTD